MSKGQNGSGKSSPAAMPTQASRWAARCRCTSLFYHSRQQQHREKHLRPGGRSCRRGTQSTWGKGAASPPAKLRVLRAVKASSPRVHQTISDRWWTHLRNENVRFTKPLGSLSSHLIALFKQQQWRCWVKVAPGAQKICHPLT